MQSLTWYLNRLSLMSGGELLWRTSRAVSDRLAHLRPPATAPGGDAARVQLPAWTAPAGIHASPYVEAAERILAGEAELYGAWRPVGKPGEIDWNRDPASGVRAPLVPGKRLDYRDARLVGSARNVWELNRHFQLVMLGQAWALTRDRRYRDAAVGLIEHWIESCPYPLGINWASALEHGLRLVNWYLAARLLGLAGGDVRAARGWLESIYRHCDFIRRNQSRHSSANNHLIGEMTGLYVAAAAWPCWPESERWRAEARRILEREAVLQVHPDGVTREQTVGYQVFVLQLLVIAGLTGEAHGDAFSEQYWRVVQRMLVFLCSIRDVGGNLPAFGDSDEGVAFLLAPDAHPRRADDLLSLAQAWSSLADAAAPSPSVAWLLTGFPRPAHWPAGAVAPESAFRDGGYYLLGARSGEREEVKLVFDAAPLGYLSIAAHGHADCLSFTLSIDGCPVLVDPGTYCYHEDAAWRDYFRSTRAHNTLCVDGADQSQMAGPFMWRRKAQPTLESLELGAQRQRVRARHDGYRALADPVLHTREIMLDVAGARAEVIDRIDAARAHLLERYWHFGAACSVRLVADTVAEAAAGPVTVTLELDPGTKLRLYRGSLEPRSGWLSPRYGELRETDTLCAATTSSGPATLRTTISWRRP